MKYIEFRGYFCNLIIDKYPNNDILLILKDIEDNCEVITITIHLPDERLDMNEVIINDYGNNVGIEWILRDNNIISYPLRKTKDNKYNICTLLN